jgi:hypothetical protein
MTVADISTSLDLTKNREARVGETRSETTLGNPLKSFLSAVPILASPILIPDS